MRVVVVAGLCAVTFAAAHAQQERMPTARLISAPRITMPGAVDSNIPMTWDLVDGSWRLFALMSWGGSPALLSGASLDQMRSAGPITIEGHPGDGVWIESLIPDEAGTWYAYYHHERPADECGRHDRFIPRIGAARSRDRGVTWEHLGIVLEAPLTSVECASSNRYVLGGVGDLSAMLTPDRRDLVLFFSQYSRVPAEQGVAVARLAWADRDAPVGRVTIWQNGSWLPARHHGAPEDAATAARRRSLAHASSGGQPSPAVENPGVPAVARSSGQLSPASDSDGWEYPAGTPLMPVSKPWHDGNMAADSFWGPSVHWNHYLERYVMLLNRTRDEHFANEGLYISYARTLDDPREWSAPRKIMNDGGWYPQVAGLEPMTGTDKLAGQRARFLVTGRSDHFIEFQR